MSPPEVFSKHILVIAGGWDPRVKENVEHERELRMLGPTAGLEPSLPMTDDKWLAKTRALRPGFDEILVPGEQEARRTATKSANGVPIDNAVLADMQALGQELNLQTALDGIAARKGEDYLRKSLVEPNADIAENYPAPVSPMPPMNLLLGEQEIEDVLAYIATLK